MENRVSDAQANVGKNNKTPWSQNRSKGLIPGEDDFHFHFSMTKTELSILY
jgi:hypothetical protein